MAEKHDQMMMDTILHIRARPHAQKTKIASTMADGTLKIDVAAAPEDNAANLELLRFIAEMHGVPKNAVTLVSGFTSKKKIVRISR